MSLARWNDPRLVSNVQVEALLTRYQALVVALPRAESLTIKRDEAKAWTERTEALLSEPLSDDLSQSYEVGIHCATGITLFGITAKSS